MAPKRESGKLVAENRKARFNYDIEEKLEAGIALRGSEVKSLRAGRANIAEAYASDERRRALSRQRPYRRICRRRPRRSRADAPAQALVARARDRAPPWRHPASGHDRRAAQALFQRARDRQGRAWSRQRQETARQARDGEEAGLGSAEGPPDAREGLKVTRRARLSSSDGRWGRLTSHAGHECAAGRVAGNGRNGRQSRRASRPKRRHRLSLDRSPRLSQSARLGPDPGRAWFDARARGLSRPSSGFYARGFAALRPEPPGYGLSARACRAAWLAVSDLER